MGAGYFSVVNRAHDVHGAFVSKLDADNKALFLEKKKIDKEETEFTMTVDKKPARAGIDPYNKLIDRRPKDNTIGVEIG